MPPQDTTYILGQTGPPPPAERMVIIPSGDTIYLPDSFFGAGGYDGWKLRQEQEEKDAAIARSGSSGTTFILIFIIILIIVSRVHRKLDFTIKASGRKRRELAKKLIDGKGIQYDNWLGRYNPYYDSLSPELRHHFLQRTVEFMESKEFRFHFMQQEEYIPLLISAAAVQVTFGLKRFLIEYFPVINIVKSAYTIPGRDHVLEGHVNANNQTINISWNTFSEDYKDYTDSENLGLHEMAHAISFDFLYGNHENRNAIFTARFKEYIQEAGPVFKDLCQGRNDLLDDYGSINVEEFWAVCVETFFENAEEFKRKMPDLYLSVTEVLNQDPLKPDKIIDKELAGLVI